MELERRIKLLKDYDGPSVLASLHFAWPMFSTLKVAAKIKEDTLIYILLKGTRKEKQALNHMPLTAS